MERLLQFLASDGSFLYRDYGFRFVDSRSGGPFGDAWIQMTNGTVGVLLSVERGGLYLDLRSESEAPKWDWYPLVTVRSIATGRDIEPSGLSKENLAFLKNQFRKVELLFGRRSWATTKKRLKARLKSKRVEAGT